MARPDYTDIAPRVSAEPRRADRHRRQSEPRSVPRQPGRPVARVVSAARTRSSRCAIYYKDIKSFITDGPVTRDLRRSRRRHRRSWRARRRGAANCSTARSPSTSAPTAAAARSRASSSSVTQPIARRLRRHTATTRTRTPKPTTAIRCRATRRTRSTCHGVLRERAPQRAALVHVSLGLLRDLRPLDAAEPEGARVARRVGGGERARQRRGDVRRASTSPTRRSSSSRATSSGRARSTTTAAMYYAGVRLKF